MADISDGIVIGGAGGAIAGLTIWIIQSVKEQYYKNKDCKTVYSWLKKNTSRDVGQKFRSTRAIASHNNLTVDRVRYICSIDNRIFLSTGKKDDLWALHEHAERSEADLVDQGFIDI